MPRKNNKTIKGNQSLTEGWKKETMEEIKGEATENELKLAKMRK